MKSKLILSASALVILSGCSVVQGNSGTVRSAQTVDMTSYFSQRLAEGRRHLDANRPAQAVEAFRQASYDARFAPQALNGMGVAYVMLGREDTAQRMFERAVEADPTDDRFARNLARLQPPVRYSDEQQPFLAKAEIDEPGLASNTIPPIAEISEDLEEGRRLLRAERPVLAIEAFRRAAEDGRFTAQAYNGMGVAYSELGNEDVARRMFERAIELAPADLRFVRNLARLEGVPQSPAAEPAYALATAPVEPEVETTRVTASGELLEQTAKEVRVDRPDDGGSREKRITYISVAVVQPIDDNGNTTLGHNENAPDYSQTVELFASARRQIGVPKQIEAVKGENVTYLMRPAVAWLGSETAESISAAQNNTDGLKLDDDTRLAMNFKQAWLESGSLGSF